MRIGRQRRPLTPGRHVPGTEVSYGQESGPLGDDTGLTNLKGGPQRKFPFGDRDRQMANGLAVGADESHVGVRGAGCLQEITRRLGKELPQQHVEMTNFTEGVGMVGKTEDPTPDPRRIRTTLKMEEIHLEIVGLPGDLH